MTVALGPRREAYAEDGDELEDNSLYFNTSACQPFCAWVFAWDIGIDLDRAGACSENRWLRDQAVKQFTDHMLCSYSNFTSIVFSTPIVVPT